MATIVASKAGNWSDTTVWTGGVLPGAGDYASTAFAITLDQDITILGLRFTSGSGIINVAGSTNRTVNLTASDAFTFNGSNPINSNYINITNTATTNINSYFPQDTVNSGTKVINCNSIGGIINITTLDGFLTRGGGTTRVSQPVIFGASSQNQIVNITGNIAGGAYGQTYLTLSGTNNVVNFTGNIVASSTDPNTTADFTYTASTNCTLNFTGTVTGNIQAVFMSTSNTSIMNINGIIGGSTAASVVQSTGNGLVQFSGIVNNLNNGNTLYAKYLRLKNGTDTQMTFQTQVLGQNKTLYSGAAAVGLPATSNVRQSIVYGDASQYTGTMIVPNPSDVRVNVPTDNTVGTASLTAEDMWNKLTSDITTTGSIGKLIKDNIDVKLSTVATNSGVISELNTSNEDVAVRLRSAATVETTGSQITAI